MNLAMLDKGSKVVPIWEVYDDGHSILGAALSRRRGRLIKAHIAPAGSNGILGGGDGRLVTLVVKWNGWNETHHHWATVEGATSARWHPPCMAVYVGRCNKVVGRYSALGSGEGEASVWDVVELVKYEGSGRIADSVRHIGQLVSQSLVGVVEGE